MNIEQLELLMQTFELFPDEVDNNPGNTNVTPVDFKKLMRLKTYVKEPLMVSHLIDFDDTVTGVDLSLLNEKLEDRFDLYHYGIRGVHPDLIPRGEFSDGKYFMAFLNMASSRRIDLIDIDNEIIITPRGLSVTYCDQNQVFTVGSGLNEIYKQYLVRKYHPTSAFPIEFKPLIDSIIDVVEGDECLENIFFTANSYALLNGLFEVLDNREQVLGYLQEWDRLYDLFVEYIVNGNTKAFHALNEQYYLVQRVLTPTAIPPYSRNRS